MRKRLKPAHRRRQILDAALALAERQHYATMTRDGVAEAAGVSMGLVTRYFSTMPQLRRAVMRAAVADGNVAVVGQGLAHRDPQALKADATLRAAAARHLQGVA